MIQCVQRTQASPVLPRRPSQKSLPQVRGIVHLRAIGFISYSYLTRMRCALCLQIYRPPTPPLPAEYPKLRPAAHAGTSAESVAYTVRGSAHAVFVVLTRYVHSFTVGSCPQTRGQKLLRVNICVLKRPGVQQGIPTPRRLAGVVDLLLPAMKYRRSHCGLLAGLRAPTGPARCPPRRLATGRLRGARTVRATCASACGMS